jgi:hypothetical protein
MWRGVIGGKPTRTRFIWSHVTPIIGALEAGLFHRCGKNLEYELGL